MIRTWAVFIGDGRLGYYDIIEALHNNPVPVNNYVRVPAPTLELTWTNVLFLTII